MSRDSYDPRAPTVQRPAVPRPDVQRVAGTRLEPDRNPASQSAALALAAAVAAGALVSLTLGVYAKVHEPTFVAINVAGFSGPIAVKAWLTTLSVTLAVGQLISAMILYRGFGGKPVRWVGAFHVWSGRGAVLASVPVAVHCLYALGLADSTPRILAHSLAGCLVYGVFAAKMLLLSRKGLPAWVIPVAGGVLFCLLVLAWATSALWFFTTSGLKF